MANQPNAAQGRWSDRLITARILEQVSVLWRDLPFEKWRERVTRAHRRVPVSMREALEAMGSARDTGSAIELIVARALFDGGVWSSPRASNGVLSYRMVERGPGSVRVCGQIWAADHALHSFWLDVERPTSKEPATWTLHFDIDARSPRTHQARNVLDEMQDPDEVGWIVTLRGRD